MDNLQEDEAVKMRVSGSPSLKVTHCDAVVEFVKVAVPNLVLFSHKSSAL